MAGSIGYDVIEVARHEPEDCVVCGLLPDVSVWYCQDCGMEWHCKDLQSCRFCFAVADNRLEYEEDKFFEQF